MVVSLLPRGPVDVGELIAKRSYARAAKVLRERIRNDPANVSLELQLADVLQLDGQVAEAVTLLVRLADGYARGGFVAKAIALFKKVQRLDPDRGAAMDRKIASLSKERDEEAARGIAFREALQASAAAAAPAPSPEPGSGYAELDLSGIEDAAAEGPSAGNELERMPLFSDFSGDELVEVMRGLRLVAFRPGDIVVAEGEPGDSLFVLTTGSVKVFCKGPRGDYRKVREMGEGDFFGEVSILTGMPRSATITAATPLELLELDAPTLDSIAERHPHVLTVLRDFCESRAGSVEEIRVRVGRTGPPPAPAEAAAPGPVEES